MGPIPAKIFWPGLCIALLLMSIGVGVTTIVYSQSDGGAQVVDDYKRTATETSEKGDRSAKSR